MEVKWMAIAIALLFACLALTDAVDTWGKVELAKLKCAAYDNAGGRE